MSGIAKSAIPTTIAHSAPRLNRVMKAAMIARATMKKKRVKAEIMLPS